MPSLIAILKGWGTSLRRTDAGSRCILISGGGQENYFLHCNVGIDTVQRTNANATVEIAGGGPRNIFENCTFPIWSSDGLQFALLGAAAAALDRWVLFRNCSLHGNAVVRPQLLHRRFKLTAASGGLVDPLRLHSVGFTYQADNDATTEALMYLGMAVPPQVGWKLVIASS